MLVIFDCDGVLVDSERLASQVFSEQLHKVGISKTPEQCFATFKGHTLTTCLDMLQLDYDRVIPASFLDDLKVATEKTFSKQLKAVDGVERVLQSLTQRGIPFCVASNGGYAKVQNSLMVTGLLSYFPPEHCFSAESVKKGKPEPDLFLWAAQKMGHKALDVIIIEDSETGVKAGFAAGMKVLLFVDGGDVGDRCFNVSPHIQVKSFSYMSKLSSLLRVI